MPTIGIVLHDFTLGGTERIATRLARAWAERGARVTIFCGSGEGEMRALLGDRVQVIEARPVVRRGRGSRLRLGKAAAGHFTAHPVDVCFLPGNFHWVIAPALARIAQPVRPAIVAQVSAALTKPQRGWSKQRGFEARMRWLLRGAAAVIALSRHAGEQARAILKRPIVETIALPALADDIAPPTPAPDNLTIVAVGRLVPEKGFDTLIDAMQRVPGADLVIVGEGPDRTRLEARIATGGLAARVRLPGYAADPRPWLDGGRLAVLPSRFEGYPAVLIEAFAAGRPVVATDCTPATGELIDAGNGRIVPIDDAPAMAAAIGTMLASPPPDPLALAARVRHHRIGPVADAYLALFARLVAARRG